MKILTLRAQITTLVVFAMATTSLNACKKNGGQLLVMG